MMERVRLGTTELHVSPPNDLAAIEAALADATPVWGPHPEGMPSQEGGAD